MATPPSIPDFEVLRQLGVGASGEVWEARHSSGERVALKLLRATVSRHGLAREIDASGRLDHPNVVQLWDVGFTDEADSRPWLALEFLSGGSLADVFFGMDWEGIRLVLDAVLEGLAHAHAHGVVHRDLKPANVLRASPGGRWVIADFGIARLDGARGSGRISGTPGYMAPEQRRGDWRREGPHTDLWAVGAMAWGLCCGQLPDDGPFAPRLLLPVGLRDWMSALLASDPADRVDLAADALAALRALGPAIERPPRKDATPFPAAQGGETWTTELDLEPAESAVSTASIHLPPAPGVRVPRRLGPIPPGQLGVARVGRRPPPAPDVGVGWEELEALDRPRWLQVVGPRDAGGEAWIGAFCREVASAGRARVVDLREGQPDLWEQLPPSILDSAPSGAVAGATGADRIRTWLLLLAHAAQERPVVVRVDPEQGAQIRESDVGRILAVETAESAGPADRVVLLEPRVPVVVQAALGAVLPLDPETLAGLVARSGGYPGRAVGLLESLCREGHIAPGPQGFRRTGAWSADPEVPPSSAALAVGGDQVRAKDWRVVLERLGLPPDDGRWLVERGHARFTHDGVSFPGTGGRLNLIPAGGGADAARQWLARLGAVSDKGLSAELLLRAGRESEGVRAASIALHRRGSEVSGAWSMIALLEGLGQTDEARAMALVLRGDLAVDAGDRQSATELADAALALSPGSAAVVARVAVVRAQVARLRGEPVEPSVREALAAFERDGDTSGVEGCHLWLAELAVDADREAGLVQLDALSGATDPAVRASAVRLALVTRAASGEQPEGAIGTAQAELDRALAEGRLMDAMQLLNSLGTLYRQVGDQAGRRRVLNQGAALAVGQREVRAIFSLNAGQAALEQGDVEQARATLETALRCTAREDLGAVARVGLACCALIQDEDAGPLERLALEEHGAALGPLLVAAPHASGALRQRIMRLIRSNRSRYVGDREFLARIDAALDGTGPAR